MGVAEVGEVGNKMTSFDGNGGGWEADVMEESLSVSELLTDGGVLVAAAEGQDRW